MRVAILSQGARLYSTRRLVEAFTKVGANPQIIDPRECYAYMQAGKSELYFKGQPVENFDAVLPRISTSMSASCLPFVRQCEMRGLRVVNSADGIGKAQDKLMVHQLMSEAGIQMPKTAYGISENNTEELIRLVGGAPVVFKVRSGTHGKGVLLIDSEKSARSVLNAFHDIDLGVLVQEYVEVAGKDVRCFVVGGRVVGAMVRQAAPGDFRANIHRGGKGTNTQLTHTEEQMAVRVAKLVGLEIAGVDIIRSEYGPLLLEINASPGLEGIEGATKRDIAGAIAEHTLALIKARSR